MRSTAPAGWYTVPGSAEVRWRDDQHWTAYRIVNGRPSADWYATEPPLIGYALGTAFLALGVAQGALAISSGNPLIAIFMLVLGAFWLSAGIAGSVVRRKPAPVSAPIAPACAQPVPGQAEGPDAGWYPVSAQTGRWWSGTRWGSYVCESHRVRPTFGGPRMYRTVRIVALAMIVVGVLALVGGVAVLLIGGGEPAWLGWLICVIGASLAIAGAVVFPTIGMRRGVLLMPDRPPRPRPADPTDERGMA